MGRSLLRECIVMVCCVQVFASPGIVQAQVLPDAAATTRKDDKPAKGTPEKRPTQDVLPELVTDRPDFTEATETVRPGVVQVEMGITLDREGGARHLSQGEVLTRFGITRRAELRFSGDGLVGERSNGGVWKQGVADTEVGVKIAMWEQKHFLPALSVIPILSMPSGARAFTSATYDPTLKILLAEDLRAGFTLAGNLNFSSVTGDEGRIAQNAWSISLGHGLSRNYAAYWEAFSFTHWGTEVGSPAAYLVNTGITRSLGGNAQFDVRVGQRLTDVGPNWFLGMGFALRRPTHFLFH